MMTIDPTEKVHHVVSGGLKAGKVYNVYVSQVNTSGLESNKSTPSRIRVGDITAPDTPVIRLDKSKYPSGCHAVGATCDVYFCWERPACDDLDYYGVYVWKNRPQWYSGDKAYDKAIGETADMSFLLSGEETSASVGGQKSGNIVYIGVQAIDYSRNRSNIYVLRVSVQDNSFLAKPTEPLLVSTYSIWALRVQTRCPNYDNIKAIEIFRDGEDSIAKLLFVQGVNVEYIDMLSVETGLTHYYTYRYITEDNRFSPMSDPSKTVTAQVIDLRYINKAKLEEFNDVWSKDGIKEIETLSKQAKEEAKKTKEIADKLAQATKDYNAVYNKYTLLVNQFSQLSAKVEQDESTIKTLRTSIEQTAKAITLKADRTELNTATNKINSVISSQLTVNANEIRGISTRIDNVSNAANNATNKINSVQQALQTKITQNANAITLRASKGDIDTATNQLRQNLVSQIKVQADRVATVVSSQNGATTQITQLNNAIQLCATKDSVTAAVNLAVQGGLSVATLIANRIVITGEMLFQGNARLVGRLSANYLAVCDQNGKIIWGSDTGVIKPQIITTSQGGRYSCQGAHNTWLEMCRIQLTPQPPVNFNGQSMMKITCTLVLELEMEGNADANGAGYGTIGDLKIDNVDATINGTSIGSPLAKLQGNGVNLFQAQGNRLDYFPVTGGGWRTNGRRGLYTSQVSFTMTYNGSATIGRAVRIGLFGRISDPSNGICIRKITAVNPSWRIECS